MAEQRRQRRRRRRWHRWLPVAAAAALLVYLQLCLQARLQLATTDDRRTAAAAPNSTAAPALTLGAAPPSTAGSSSAAGHIPMLVHQTWRDDGFPKDMFNFRWQEALMALNPGWKLMRWTDATMRQLIADEFPCAAPHGLAAALPLCGASHRARRRVPVCPFGAGGSSVRTTGTRRTSSGAMPRATSSSTATAACTRTWTTSAPSPLLRCWGGAGRSSRTSRGPTTRAGWSTPSSPPKPRTPCGARSST